MTTSIKVFGDKRYQLVVRCDEGKGGRPPFEHVVHS